ncbi:response regulator transcription factor [Burkholderia sp. BE17]|uniref:response regulator transcription factor n=1 Tax=Burkholderia sp. BE17 TaxID=2656644 RepID=UPI00128D6CC7|nr:response regulator transcription factor [Burkholderia sp. BE17]MPV68645.1 hypothetical protein [Burkholderia sp. BE17]
MKVLVVSRLAVWRIGVKSVLSRLLSEEVEILEAADETAMLAGFGQDSAVDLFVLDGDVASESSIDALSHFISRASSLATIVLTDDEAQRALWRGRLPEATLVDKRRPLLDFTDAVLTLAGHVLERRWCWPDRD